MPTPLPKGVTLRGLEVFESLARTGSVAATAGELGLSAPAVSQQMKNLAGALGAELLDNSRRPMTLTPAGRVFLQRTASALDSLRSGHRDLNALDLTELSALSMGIIEDFENEVTPTLAARLAEAMSQCAFRLQTGPSHELAARIAERELDIAICAAPGADPAGSVPHPLVRDPYIVAVPRGTPLDEGAVGAVAPVLSAARHGPAHGPADRDLSVGHESQPAAPVRDGLQPVDQRARRLGHRAGRSRRRSACSGPGASRAASTPTPCPAPRSSGGSCSMRPTTGPVRSHSRSPRWRAS